LLSFVSRRVVKARESVLVRAQHPELAVEPLASNANLSMHARQNGSVERP